VLIHVPFNFSEYSFLSVQAKQNTIRMISTDILFTISLFSLIVFYKNHFLVLIICVDFCLRDLALIKHAIPIRAKSPITPYMPKYLKANIKGVDNGFLNEGIISSNLFLKTKERIANKIFKTPAINKNEDAVLVVDFILDIIFI